MYSLALPPYLTLYPILEEEIGTGPVHSDQAIRDRRDDSKPDARDGREDVEGDDVAAGGDREEHGDGEDHEAEEVRLSEADQGYHTFLKAGRKEQGCWANINTTLNTL